MARPSHDTDTDDLELPAIPRKATGRPRTDPVTIDKALTAYVIYGTARRAIDEAELDVPQRTLSQWVHDFPERVDHIREHLAPQLEAQVIQEAQAFIAAASRAKFEALQHTRITLPDLKDPSTALRNIAVAEGLAIDKKLTLEGRPTKITAHRTTDEVLNGLKSMGLVIDTTAEEDPTP